MDQDRQLMYKVRLTGVLVLYKMRHTTLYYTIKFMSNLRPYSPYNCRLLVSIFAYSPQERPASIGYRYLLIIQEIPG
jgi:hypothetical protein